MLSGDNRIKVEIHTRKMARKSPNTYRLNNTLLNITWVKEEIAMEIRKYSWPSISMGFASMKGSVTNPP